MSTDCPLNVFQLFLVKIQDKCKVEAFISKIEMFILWKTSFHLQFSSFEVSTKKSEVTQVTPISNLRRNELMISSISSNFILHNSDRRVYLLFLYIS